MFEYEKDKYQLMAEAEGDRAFAEVIKVANDFAAKINSRYHRTVTDWSVYSTFDTVWWDNGKLFDGDVHRTKFGKDVDLDVSKLEFSESVECALELEQAWNDAMKLWRRTDESIDSYYEHDNDYMAEQLGEALDAYEEQKLDDMADIVERWLDYIECWYWSSEYADELRQEDAA